MGSRQPDYAPGGVLVLDVAPATPSYSALPDDAPDLPDNVTLFTRHYTMLVIVLGITLVAIPVTPV